MIKTDDVACSFKYKCKNYKAKCSNCKWNGNIQLENALELNTEYEATVKYLEL